MSLFSQLKNNSSSTEKKEETVSNNSIEIETDNEQSVLVETTLSIHPKWRVSEEKMYVYRFLHNDLPAMETGKLSVSGVEIEKSSKGYSVTAFVRNSTNRALVLKPAELLLLNKSRDIIARIRTDLSIIDTLPPFSSRPWIFEFETETDICTEIGEWSIAFNTSYRHNHVLDIDEDLKKNLSEDQIKKLFNQVKNLPILNEKQVEFTTLEMKKNPSGELLVNLLLRNGSQQELNFTQIPIIVEDYQKNIVSKGLFKFDNLVVKPNSSKPLSFKFKLNDPENINLKDLKIKVLT